ncbi:helix-turn-helix transcriptional regulator [Paractinoplanes atraurantiacus]|uniref:AAA ATPase domain-containing protein n=1 Tax=Paractinoplanes atraurantiacus TaxID=1036182 RepID=A0A285JV69_9ACTN|nr:LuxR C-terminal-related transcriptional regulator [Actinoplanes atraurantiacus]SNY62971.1 AAA ATPase domain-containing protein [Actinoplanes atraurantiacus]
METTANLIGRAGELATVTSVVDAAAHGPAALLLLGEAGIGKTALLRAAAAHAHRRGHLVVHDVLGTDPAAVTFDRLSRDRPVLIVADDADGDSARLLAAALGAAAAARVALLLATRDDGDFAPGIARLGVGPLAVDAASRLLESRAVPSPPGKRREILRRAAGNPLALLLLGDPRARVPREFTDRVRALPKVTQWLLLHAAAAGDAEAVATITLAAGGSPDLRGWAPAEEAGLVVVRDGFVRFRHPLVKAACAAGRGPRDVARAHRNLALATPDPYRQAEHLACSGTGPDERVAAALEAAAGPDGRATAALAAAAGSDPRIAAGLGTPAGSAYLATAHALELAAERSPDAAGAARRYARAVFAAHRGGDPQWTVELYEKALARTTDPDTVCLAAAGAGFALLHRAQPGRAFDIASQAVRRRPRDGQAALAAAVVAAAAVLLSGDPGHRRQLPQLLACVRDDVHPAAAGGTLIPRAENDLARATVLAIADPDAHAGTPLPEPSGIGPANLTRMLFTGALAFMLDDSARCAAELRAMWDVGPRFGATGSALTAFPHTVLAMIDSGRWSDADRLLDTADRTAAIRAVPLLREVVPVFRATLHALRTGTPPDPPPLPAPPGTSLAAGLTLRAAGLAALHAGDYDTAYLHFRRMFDGEGVPRHYFLGPRSLPQLALAAAQTRRGADALDVLKRCGTVSTDRMAMLVAHATALLDTTGAAEERFLEAVSDPRRALRWPLEYAEAQLNLGLWLRNRRRLHDARPHLLAARDTFLRLGAHAHADQAHRSLPVGLRPAGDPTPEAGALSRLTAQKQLIARMVAEGLTNRQIAERLYLSPRTVGSHLYRIYAELGVGNRHQLRALVPLSA